MRRRTFVARTGLALTGTALAPGSIGALGTHIRRADLLLRGGLVVDGTGAPGFEAEVLVRGGRIAAVGPGLAAEGAEIVGIAGRVVAPGFIDIHSHTDTELLSDPRAESKVRQGVTLEVAGQDGGSEGPTGAEAAERARARWAEQGIDGDFSSLPGFLRTLERHPAAVNFASMVGAGTVRGHVIGGQDRPATEAELARMVALVEAALAGGAVGISSGLEYTPGAFADRNELAALAAPAGRRGLPYASHMRNEDDALLAAVEEALFVGARSGAPVHISHLKAQGERNWWKAERVLELLEARSAAGVDVTFDRYPYVAYSTGLSNLFPVWAREGGNAAFQARRQDPVEGPRIEAAVRDKIAQLGSWDAVQVTSPGSAAVAWARGRRLGALAAERGVEPYALLLQLMAEGGGGMVGFGMSEENTARILAHPLGMICSDGSAMAVDRASGAPHPRSFGTFPRVLGHYVRETGALTLEAAVHKMSGMPAARLRLAERGRIAPGMAADLVVFDPATVADRATFEAPFQYPVGIEHTLVNGAFVLREGERTAERPGQVVRPAVGA